MEKGKGGGDGTGDNEEYENYDTTVLFSVSIFQYLFVALAFSKGPPHRATPFSNCKYIPQANNQNMNAKLCSHFIQ